MNLADFHFLRPLWLLALPAAVWLAWAWAHRRAQAGDWTRVCDAALLPHLLDATPGGSPRRGRRPQRWLGAALALAVVALAGPTWERLPQPVYRQQSALVIALDLSRSMDAADLKPSRLERARYKVADLLVRRREGQTALIVYAAEAFAVSPLTDDVATLMSQLPVLTSDLMPAQGSHPAQALRKADELFEQAGVGRGDVLLVTDGVSAAEIDRIEAAERSGPHRLAVLGVGTAEGAPIPSGRGFAKDRKGNPILSRLEETSLRALAEAGGGIYTAMTVDDRDIRALTDLFAAPALPTQAAKADVEADRWREAGPWLLLPLLPLAAIVFRRGILALLLVALVPWPPPATALDLTGLWQRPDRQAARALEHGDPRRAAELFTDPAWKATALYRARDYEQAARTLDGREGADNHYNRGNALARLGRYEEALEAYERALAVNPGHDDARYNRELVRRQIEQRQRDQEGQGQSGGPQGGEGSAGGQSQPSPDQPQGDTGEQPEQSTAPRADEEGLTREETPSPSRQDEEGNPGGRAQKPSGESQRQAQPDRTAPQGEQPSAEAPAPARGEQPREQESTQADEQWLRRIPDDPGGLLRRKFLYQYSQLQKHRTTDEPW